MKKLILILMASFMALNISLFAAGNAALVETTKIVKGEVNPLQEYVGTLNFDKKSVLAAQNSGLVQNVNFDLGNNVKKNQTLVKVDTDLLKAQIDAARANLEIAVIQNENSKKDYERYKKLLETKAITQKEYDDISLKSNQSFINVQALKARLAELEIQKDKKDIKAPFNGTITSKNVEVGQWVNAGTTIATLVNTSKASFVFNVPLNVANGLKVGATYDIDINSQILKAKLEAIVPSGDRLTRTFPIKLVADIKNGFVYEGQEAKIKLPIDAKKEALILPRDAVIKRFGRDVVFAIDDKNTANMIPVNIVGFIGKNIAVNGNGLVEGMNIVSKGNERVFPKMPVQIINK